MSKTKEKSNRSKKAENNSNSGLDLVLWAIIFLGFCVGVGLTYYYSALAMPLKLSGWILLLLGLSAIAFKTQKGTAVFDFAKKSRVELRKVVWPTRQETIQATAIVGLIVVLTSLMLWLIDSGLVYVASLATGQRG